MLKLQPFLNLLPITTTKCGEIFCHNFKDFTIFCQFCQMKSFKFDDFILHLQNGHLANDLQKSAASQINKNNEKFWDENYDYELSDTNDNHQRGLESYEDENCFVLKKSKRNYKLKLKPKLKECVDIFKDEPGTDELENTYKKTYPDNAESTTKKLKENEYTCTECSKIFLQKKYLDQHVQEIHNGYKCALCDKRFKRSYHVEYHLKTHITEKKFICPIENCCRGFTDENYLKRHLEVHTMERNFICDYENCGKAFQTHRRLASHQYTHRIPKKFVCDMCGHSCRSNTELITHQRVHTGEKPFSCKVCGKPFISKSALSEHMISHSETRPHKCAICNKAFANRRVMVRHSFIHNEEKTFKCKLCEIAFRHPNSLQGHLRHVHCEPKKKANRKSKC